MIVFGINPVLEALRAGRVRALQVGSRADDRMRAVLQLADAHGVRVARVDASVLDRISRRGVHQGVIAELGERAPATLAEIVRAAAGPPLIVVLDGIEDPHNVGAILRTVDAAGGHGVIRQSRRAAPLDAVAAKASAGAMAWVHIADVVNIARALDELKELNVWTVGLAGEASQSYERLDLTLPTAVVLGNEGSGLRRLVRDRCDVLASIPLAGHVSSLNVSVAAGVVLFEAVRQRRERHGFPFPAR
jgi:23S rRNA (guanosine2251-2'-O)-methyltransferase